MLREVGHSADPSATGPTLVQHPTTNESVEVRLDEVHWRAMLEGLCVHLDDAAEPVQNAVYQSLQRGVITGALPFALMRSHLLSVRPRHRSPRLIDALLEQLPADAS